MTDEGYTFLPLYDAEVDEDKMQKIINLLNELGIKDFVRFARKEIHFLNLTDSQIEKLLEAQSNEYKDDFGLVGVRKHSNQPFHYYLQLREEQRRIEGLKENYYKISADLMRKLRAIDRILNNSYETTDKKYTTIKNSSDELAVAYARAQLDLITKIVDEVKKI